MVDLMRLERTTSCVQSKLSPVEIQTQINGWYSNPHFRATIHYTFGFAYNVAPLRTTECFSITFNAFYCRVSRAGTLSLMVRVVGLEPTHHLAEEPKSSESTISTIPAYMSDSAFCRYFIVL